MELFKKCKTLAIFAQRSYSIIVKSFIWLEVMPALDHPVGFADVFCSYFLLIQLHLLSCLHAQLRTAAAEHNTHIQQYTEA